MNKWMKDVNRHLTEEDRQVVNKYMKMLLFIIYQLGNCK